MCFLFEFNAVQWINPFSIFMLITLSTMIACGLSVVEHTSFIKLLVVFLDHET